LVGYNWAERVLENVKDVVVVFVHHDHDECTVAYDFMEEMAYEFANNYYLMIGFMEWKFNGVEGIFPPKFPSVLMIPGNKKNEKYFWFEGELNRKNLVNFIKEHSA
jgi:hypothetical protein